MFIAQIPGGIWALRYIFKFLIVLTIFFFPYNTLALISRSDKGGVTYNRIIKIYILLLSYSYSLTILLYNLVIEEILNIKFKVFNLNLLYVVPLSIPCSPLLCNDIRGRRVWYQILQISRRDKVIKRYLGNKISKCSSDSYILK
uniref:Uncharacterized protein n=1 Tax=Apiospora arundinis TaxID=335852 RepID=A0A220IDA7_9PEZI|nr:hypothetical protein [Apiospora arundinis]ASH96106.1 hypothetical protein [Apiospora arundinis]